MAESRSSDVSGFFDKIAPGGKYFKYSISALVALGVILVGLTAVIVLPLLTNGRFQTPLSRTFLGPVPVVTTPAPAANYTPAPTICPNYVIPSGRQEFNFSPGPLAVGPKIQTAVVDPLDPATNQKQTITLTIKNDSPVTHASATLYTDNSQETIDMTLINGSTTDGTWQLSWPFKDSYKCQYFIKFDLRSNTGNYNDGLHIR